MGCDTIELNLVFTLFFPLLGGNQNKRNIYPEFLLPPLLYLVEGKHFGKIVDINCNK